MPRRESSIILTESRSCGQVHHDVEAISNSIISRNINNSRISSISNSRSILNNVSLRHSNRYGSTNYQQQVQRPINFTSNQSSSSNDNFNSSSTNNNNNNNNSSSSNSNSSIIGSSSNNRSTSICKRSLLSLLACSMSLLLVSSSLGIADAGAMMGHPFSKRSFMDIQCKGVYDKSLFARLDRICEDCYNLFREPQLHTLCRKNCFTSDYFKGCLDVLLLQDEMEWIQTSIKQLHGADPGV